MPSIDAREQRRAKELLKAPPFQMKAVPSGFHTYKPYRCVIIVQSCFDFLEWVYPSNCKDDNSCAYKATWIVEEEVVKFVIVAKQPESTWTGIGMAREKKIVSYNTDIIGAIITILILLER